MHRGDALLVEGGDIGVAALAATQEAVISTEQLHAAGLGRGAIALRVRRGRLHRVHRGVYVVGVARLTPRGRLWAAVLACGAPYAAVISHATAAMVWRIRDRGPSRIEITTLGRSAPRAALRVHTSLTLDAQRDVACLDGLPVTIPARTLVDLAPRLTSHELERACHEAAFLGLLHLPDIDRRLATGPGGARKLRAALDAVARHGPQHTKSELEEIFLSLVARHELPRPLVNAVVHGYTVDFLWPDRRLVIETDGRNHLRPVLFESDRERDAVLQMHGFKVVRFTWRQLTRRPLYVANTVRTLLGQRP